MYFCNHPSVVVIFDGLENEWLYRPPHTLGHIFAILRKRERQSKTLQLMKIQQYFQFLDTHICMYHIGRQSCAMPHYHNLQEEDYSLSTAKSP